MLGVSEGPHSTGSWVKGKLEESVIIYFTIIKFKKLTWLLPSGFLNLWWNARSYTVDWFLEKSIFLPWPKSSNDGRPWKYYKLFLKLNNTNYLPKNCLKLKFNTNVKLQTMSIIKNWTNVIF